MLYFKNTGIEDIKYVRDGVLCVEQWMDIDGYEGHYMVSNLGRVKSLYRKVSHSHSGYITMPERILSQKIRKVRPDLEVNLAKDGIHSSKQVHRLVAMAFIPNPLNLPEVNHLKGMVQDNRAWELEWSTASDNQTHSYRVLNRKSSVGYGDRNPNFRIFLNTLTGIYYTYSDLSVYFGVSIDRVRGMICGKDKRVLNFIKT